MPPTTQSSLEVEDALLRAGERLGMKVFLLRMVAAELPDNHWLVGLDVRHDGPTSVARTRHLCGSSCVGDPGGCLTAFKVEDAVTKMLGEEVAITGVERDGDDRLRVRFARLASQAARSRVG